MSFATDDQHNRPLADELGDDPLLGQLNEDEPPPSALELMNAPARRDARGQKIVLLIALTFVTLLLALTVAVITMSGLDPVSILSLLIFGFIDVALIGALRYEGEDPLASFAPPQKPKRRFGRHQQS